MIPSKDNDHRPHLLRMRNIRKIIILIILLEIVSFLIPTLTYINRTENMAAVLPAVLANLTNQEREEQNLQTLTVNPILNKAAEMKAIDMARYGYFAHTSPEGKTPWYWLQQVGYQYQYAGENLAVNFSDSKDVTMAWMNSPTHKANIEKENYTEVGTGIANGIYEGKKTIFVAQLYANPIKEGSANVLGAKIMFDGLKTIQEPAFWQKLFASPRNTTNTILSIIFGVITIALLLYIFIKIENHHKDLLTNGLLVLALVGAIFVANYYFSHHNMLVATSLNYSYLK